MVYFNNFCIRVGGFTVAPGVSRRPLSADPPVPLTYTHAHTNTHACFHLRNTDHRLHFFESRSMHGRACSYTFWLFFYLSCPVLIIRMKSPAECL